MNPSNNNKKLITIDIVKANIYVLVGLVPIIIIYLIPYYYVWKQQFTLDTIYRLLHSFHYYRFIFTIIVLFSAVVIHELIHGITWAIFAKQGWKSISFGFKWQMLTPYCHCSEPLSLKHYILGALMPGIILGQLPAIIAIITGNIALLAFGIFFTLAAMGDYMIIYLLRNENSKSTILDHDSEAGCWVFEQ